MIAISSQIRSAFRHDVVEKMIVRPFDLRSSTIRSTSRAPSRRAPMWARRRSEREGHGARRGRGRASASSPGHLAHALVQEVPESEGDLELGDAPGDGRRGHPASSPKYVSSSRPVIGRRVLVSPDRYRSASGPRPRAGFTSSPSMSAVARGRERIVASMRSVVVFPAPFRPKSPNTRPGRRKRTRRGRGMSPFFRRGMSYRD